MTATHSGPVMDVPATGNHLELTNTVWFRIEDGRVVDEWPRTDILGLLEGIGIVDLPS
jgi:predicted ester cyclase